MNITLHQSEIVRMMMERIGVSTTGTYNKGDPTHYAEGSAKFEILYGYSMPKSFAIEGCDHTTQEPPCDNCKGMDPGANCPDPEVVTASFHDCTWGIEFKFVTSLGLTEGYFDNDSKKWYRVKKQKLFKRVFRDVLFAEPEGSAEAEYCAQLMGKGIV